jgi:hypothetical protein
METFSPREEKVSIENNNLCKSVKQCERPEYQSIRTF